MTCRAGAWRRAVSAAALALALAGPGTVAGQSSASGPRLDWEAGAGRSYVIPAAEIAAFILALNGFDRVFIDSEEYGSDGRSIERNLRTAPILDKDPFSVNQLGHPYQGSVYHGLARSAGLDYWRALLYDIGGSFVWEVAGETTAPSINDHVATAVGGSFVGEGLFRMASLLLEGGGEKPGFWRELGAAVISPATGFNRMVAGDRAGAVFPSRDPAIVLRLRFGGTITADVANEGLTRNVERQEGYAEFALSYGVPGKPGYRYHRPFDYFHFEFTAVPNATSLANAVENATIRGLLVGTSYEWGDDYRGLWGLFGGYDYVSPQVFRVAATNVLVGTIGQWWLSRSLALQGTALGGVGFGAAGTVDDKRERDYHYGVMPQTVLALRLIHGERVMLEANGRGYYVAGVGEGAGVSDEDLGRELIARASVGLTVRIFGPHAIGIQYLVSTREAHSAGLRDRHQAVQTVTLSYNFLGHTRFGAVEWRR
jgi:hypothetical protein